MPDLIQCHANDYAAISSRTVAADGSIKAPGVMARTGVQSYRAYELGLDAALGLDPMKIVRIYRSPEEVFAPDSLKSFQGVPVTVNHPPGNVVNALNIKQVKVGSVQNVKKDGIMMTGDLDVQPGRGTKALDTGYNQLSNGYAFALDMTPGTSPEGESYDGQQRNIRGNHLALVKSARCGAACSVADSDSLSLEGEFTMAGNTQRVVVDGMPVDTDEIAAAAIGKLIQGRDSALQERDAARNAVPTSFTIKVGDQTLTFTAEQLSTRLAADAAKIAQLEKDVFTPAQRDALVADWAGTLDTAKKLAPKVETTGKTCLQIRRDVLTAVSAGDATAKGIINAVLAGKTIGDAEPDAVRAVFNAVAAVAPGKNQTTTSAADSATGNALAGNGGSKTVVATGDTAKPMGRSAFITRSQNAYAGKQ